MSRTKPQTFGQSALIIAISSLVAKVIGAIYRVPLTNILGAEGIGQYQLVFPLFALVLALCCSAMPIVVARQVAYYSSCQDSEKIKQMLWVSVIYMLIASVIAVVFVTAIAVPLSSIQQNLDIAKCYWAIAPAIIFVAFGGIVKGWFLGLSNAMPMAISQIVEQIAKLCFGLTFAFLGMQTSIVNGVVGALLGTTLAECAGCVYLWIVFLKTKSEYKGYSRINFLNNFALLGKIATPIMLSGIIFPLIAFIDSVLVVNLLMRYGKSSPLATMEYGILTGPVNTIVNLPIVIALSFAVAIVPAISSSMATYDSQAIKQKTFFSYTTALLITMPCMLGLIIFCPTLIRLLYPYLNGQQLTLATLLMRIQSLTIVVVSMLEISNATLQGMGKSTSVFLNVLFGGLVKIVAEIFLVVKIGIIGVSIASLLFFVIALLLNSLQISIQIGKNRKFAQIVGKIVLSSVIMVMAVIGFAYIDNKVLGLLCGIGVGIIVYFVAIIMFKVLSQEQWKALPLGDKIVNLTNKLTAQRRKK